MEKESRIYVAGHGGLVGSALLRRLREEGCHRILTRSRDDLDLTRQSPVEAFFSQEQPDYVFLAAAKVGGIRANTAYPADFAYSNLQIQSNVIHAAWKYRVRKLLFLGSSCIYPKHAPQPIPESALLTGPLEPTNSAYAVAKIAGITLCQSYNRQYGTDFICVMPTNLYGVNDNYHAVDSHVVPALLRRFHEAKAASLPSVVIWGSGTPRREFLYADDLADACVFLMNSYSGSEIVNVGSGEEVTIRELAFAVKEVVGYRGGVAFDAGQPDGNPRKRLDCSKMLAMGWKPRTPLTEGLAMAYEDFRSRRNR